MKNIFLLPTEQPSRLVKIKDTFFLTTTDDIPGGTFYNICITSLEKIKKSVNQWYLDKFLNKPRNSGGAEYSDNQNVIILSTDPTLIAGGIQAIDNEFMEWFVKNPTCEFVKVIRNKKLSGKNIFDAKKGDLVFNNHGCGGIIQGLSNDIRVHILSENGEGYVETAITADNGIDTLIINNYKVHEYTDYKIIIPQEEQKQHLINIMHDDEELGLYEEPKQETLEEAAERHYINCIPSDRHSFIAGAKWQAERMYSEKEVYDLLEKTIEKFYKHNYTLTKAKMKEQWFEQFKKK
jgi:hypothetical protein